jgi:Tfp pilus assembly protein PilF
MSIILDALRGGRKRQTPRPAANPSQTDAVLATLGYGRFSPTSPFNKLKRIVGYSAIAVVFGVMLWLGVVWLTRYFSRPPELTRTVQEPIGLPSAPPSTPVAPPVVTPSPPLESAGAPNVGEPRVSEPSVSVPSGSVPNVSQPAAVSPPPSVAPPPAVTSTNPTPRPSPPARTATAPRELPGSSVSQSGDHFNLAVYNQRIGNFEESLLHWRAVLDHDPLNEEARNNLGLLYRDKGLLADAAKELQRAIAINPRYALAHNNLGVVYLSQKKLDAANAEFRQVLALEPRNVEAYVNLGISEKEAGRPDQARAAFTRAIELDTRNPDAHYNLALLEDETGNPARAVVHYKAFLQYGAVAHADLMADVRKRIDSLNR